MNNEVYAKNVSPEQGRLMELIALVLDASALTPGEKLDAVVNVAGVLIGYTAPNREVIMKAARDCHAAITAQAELVLDEVQLKRKVKEA